MTSPKQIREAIGQLLQPVADAGLGTLYVRPPSGLTVFPAVVVGRARWTPGENAYLHQWVVPVDVVVAQPGTSDQASVEQLEELWPDVLELISAAIDEDPSLGGAVATAWVARANPGLVAIGGVRFPATSIEIELHG